MRETLRAIATILIVGAIILVPVAARADIGTGSLSGTVTDTNGSAINGATVSLSGPTTASTMTDKAGTFQFASVPPGTYHVLVSKTGYADASRADVAVTGPNTAISVVLVSASVRQLGRIVVLAKASTINTTPAAVFQVTAQTFQDQGQIQLRPILEQIPGVSVEIRNGDAFNNGGAIMALGNDTLITIRGAFSYETATLVDGHNLFGGLDSIGFNAAMLNSIGLQRLDTVKGPGASSPTINDAIGGSLNYITLEPTGRAQGSISEATDGYGGSVFNFGYTGTTDNGKLGYAIAHGAQATPGGLNHHTNFFSPLGGKVNGQTLGFCFGGNTGPQCSTFFIPNAHPGITLGGSPVGDYGFNLVLCCDTEATLGKQFTDFAKVRYHFSPTTSFALTHMAEVTDNDFGGFNGLQLGGGFAAFPGYNGPGIGFVDDAQPGEFTGSHLFQSLNEYDLQTGALHGNLRLSYMGFYQFSYYFEQQFKTPPTYLAYGAVPTATPGKFIFANGLPVTAQSFNDYTIVGFTSLKDTLVEYDLPIKSSLYTISYDRTSYMPDVGQRCCGSGPGYFFDNYFAIYDHHLRGITDQILLRANFDALRNVTATTSFYMNRYNSHTADGPIFPAFNGPPGCNGNGTPPCYGLNGGNTSAPLSVAYFNSYHDHYRFYDAPRVGLTWRPTNDVSWRLAVGGAIAPVNLEDTNSRAGSSPPAPNGSPPTYYTVFKSDPNLYPETAFGYDLGADRRLPGKDILISSDVYFTNLYGLFNTINQQQGTFNGLPLIATIRTNIANSRYEGVELAVRKNPSLGFNWQINGALMKAFAYNLPPHFYDTVGNVDKNGNITWLPFTNNLAVIAGKNFNDGYFNGGPGNGTEASPYSEGYAEVSYRTTHNGLLLFGANYYGPGNNYFRPAFFVLTASARREIFPNWILEAAAHNVGDLYNGLLQASYYPTKDGNGVPVALISKQLGLAPGGVIGPRTLSLTLTRTF